MARETENGGDDAGGNEGEKKNIFYLPEPFILGWRAGGRYLVRLL
jgi:hypothetical protein